MNKLDQKIQDLFVKLPEDYQQAVGELDVYGAVDKIGEKRGLDQDKLARLDREVTYLILGMQDTPGFMLRLEEKVGLEEERVASITESVTEKIIKPLREKLESMNGNPKEDMPVPPPPPNTDMPDSTSYGGASDPYREPVDE